MNATINSIRKKIKNGVPSFGSWIMIGNLASAEILSDIDFEWLVVDMEHTAISYEVLQVLLLAIKSRGKVGLVRIENNDATVIKRVLDCGADGIIVPQVNTREDAYKAVESIKYPPEGVRGIAIGRASNYGRDFENYFNTFNKRVFIIAQIEHYRGVDNIDEIVKIEGLDGIFIGPYDLSGSMKIVGQFEHPEMKAARKRIIEVVKRKNMVLGIHEVSGEIESIKSRIAEGFNFIACGVDTVLLSNAAETLINRIGNIHYEKK